MNNFTKEELGIISWNLCVNPKTIDILKKLEFMIENYCEHDFHPVIGSFHIESCHKCMRVK